MPVNPLLARLREAMTLHQRGQLADAERAYQKILRRDPNFFDALHLLGVIAIQTGRSERGINSIARALRLQPNHADAHFNMAIGLQQLNRLEEALGSYDHCITLQPDHLGALLNRGTVLCELGRDEQALIAYNRVLALQPSDPGVHHNRANALSRLRRYDQAVLAYRQAIALMPDRPETYFNQGLALEALDRYDEAIASFDLAITGGGQIEEASWTKSIVLLRLGRLPEGFGLYEWRKKRTNPDGNRACPRPAWTGEEVIAGKTLFIHSEQGLGDTIQFFRYALLAAEQGATVCLAAQTPLCPLLAASAPNLTVIDLANEPDDYDYQIAMMSLPLAFGTTLTTIPSVPSYLMVPDETLAAWVSRLGPKTKPRIGLAWRGNPDYINDRGRSMRLETMLPLLYDTAEWYCLHNDVTPHEAALLARDGRIARPSGTGTTYTETAGLVAQMDHVIAVDTGIAHLAAAMGRPTSILLPAHADWRWFLNREDSPWYPSVRLFRQTLEGDWPPVIDMVRRHVAV